MELVILTVKFLALAITDESLFAPGTYFLMLGVHGTLFPFCIRQKIWQGLCREFSFLRLRIGVDIHSLNCSDSLEKLFVGKRIRNYAEVLRSLAFKSKVFSDEHRTHKDVLHLRWFQKDFYRVFLLEVRGLSVLELLWTTGFLLSYGVRIFGKLTLVICCTDQRRWLRRRKATLIVPPLEFELGLLGCNPQQPNIYMTKLLTYL